MPVTLKLELCSTKQEDRSEQVIGVIAYASKVLTKSTHSLDDPVLSVGESHFSCRAANHYPDREISSTAKEAKRQ